MSLRCLNYDPTLATFASVVDATSSWRELRRPIAESEKVPGLTSAEAPSTCRAHIDTVVAAPPPHLTWAALSACVLPRPSIQCWAATVPPLRVRVAPARTGGLAGLAAPRPDKPLGPDTDAENRRRRSGRDPRRNVCRSTPAEGAAAGGAAWVASRPLCAALPPEPFRVVRASSPPATSAVHGSVASAAALRGCGASGCVGAPATRRRVDAAALSRRLSPSPVPFCAGGLGSGSRRGQLRRHHPASQLSLPSPYRGVRLVLDHRRLP